MKNISFEYMEKGAFLSHAPRIFFIMYQNMKGVAEYEGTYEEELAEWTRIYGGAFLGRETRKIILAKDGDVIVGFFGYCMYPDAFSMEEMQISPEYQGKYGIFRKFYELALAEVPDGIKYTDSYAHKTNSKSIAIQNKMGLEIIGENERGDCFHLKGDFSKILDWYNGGMHNE